mmetsp:Transcript_6043/g.15383  ORF Transcript_6043/g.15383 Transcript_6043/m.15383 type:complete len:211 (-) Transcript_6043:47-679(-)
MLRKCRAPHCLLHIYMSSRRDGGSPCPVKAPGPSWCRTLLSDCRPDPRHRYTGLGRHRRDASQDARPTARPSKRRSRRLRSPATGPRARLLLRRAIASKRLVVLVTTLYGPLATRSLQDGWPSATPSGSLHYRILSRRGRTAPARLVLLLLVDGSRRVRAQSTSGRRVSAGGPSGGRRSTRARRRGRGCRLRGGAAVAFVSQWLEWLPGS